MSDKICPLTIINGKFSLCHPDCKLNANGKCLIVECLEKNINKSN